MAQELLSAPHVQAIVPTVAIVHPDLPDVDDNRLLEVALSAAADFIVTGDKELLALGSIRKPPVIEGWADTSVSPVIPRVTVADALDYLSTA